MLKKIRPVYWVLIVSVLLFAGLMMISPSEKKVDIAQLPWNAHFGQDGKLRALGLIVEQSTLKDVMAIYGRDVEVKLFEMPDGQRTAEAYFNSVYIGSIHGSMVIKLSLDDTTLNQFFERGARTTISQQGSREVQLNNDDTLALFDYPFYEVTLVPRRNLTPQAIEKRFGQPDHVKSSEQGIASWYFLDKGLELILIDGGNDILRYRVIEGK